MPVDHRQAALCWHTVTFCTNGLEAFCESAERRKRVHMTAGCLNMRFRHIKGCRFSHFRFLEGKAVIMVCGGDVCFK